MKNNKGFTLIELLAIILILGIILLIAMPSISSVVEASKKEAFETTSNNLVEHVKSTCNTEVLNGKVLGGKRYYIEEGKIKDLDIEVTGDIPYSGIMDIDEDCRVSLIASDETGTIHSVKPFESSRAKAYTNGEEPQQLKDYYNDPINVRGENSCFTYEPNSIGVTITGYKFEDETCSRDIIIPSTINGEKVTELAKLTFLDKDRFIAVRVFKDEDDFYGHDEIYDPDIEYDDDLAFYIINYKGTKLAGTNCYTAENNDSLVEKPGYYKMEDGDGYIRCHFKYDNSERDRSINEIDSIDFSRAKYLTTIPFGAAYNSNLKSLNLGNYVKKIEAAAFTSNILGSVDLPPSLEYIGSLAFSNNSLSGSLDLKNVNHIGFSSFSANNFDNVLYGKIKKIPYGAFNYNSLINIAIPDGIEYIGQDAFANNHSVNVEIAGTVKTINKEAFLNYYDNTSTITNLILHDGIEEIGYQVFTLGAFKNLVIPGSVKTIGHCAFCENKALTNLEIKDGVELIKDNAFCNDTSIESVRIPGSVKTIEYHAFSDVSNMKTLDLEEGIESIGSFAFYRTLNLKKVVLPNSLKSLEGHAFSQCTGLEELTIGTGLKTITDSSFYSHNIKNLVIPDNITTIEDGAFWDDIGYELTSVTFGKNLKTIGKDAFRNNSLTSLVIPNSVTKLDQRAFYNKGTLKDISIGTSVSKINKNCFYGVSNATINVNRKKGSISGSPWGATDTTVNWLG